MDEVERIRSECEKWRALCQWAYDKSCSALMMPPERPREARQAREQALCDINKELGRAIR